MYCPFIKDLPPTPDGKTRWPWTEGPDTLWPSSLPRTNLPKVSIVTPSYNQGRFLEETIRSVLLQGYPNMEYFVVDGGSTDNSIDIIQKYAPWISWWVSEKDLGQSHAVNKGFAHVTGDVVAWLNSDDLYMPGAIFSVISALLDRPDVSFVYGSAQFINENGAICGDYCGRPLPKGTRRLRYWNGWPVPQPTLFFRRTLLEQYGGLNENYHYSMDYEFVIRISQKHSCMCLDRILAQYRLHASSKTGEWEKNKKRFFEENVRINRIYAPVWNPRNWYLWLCWLITSARRIMP